MKKTVFKKILPILLTAVIFLSAIVPTFAASISAPTEDDPYYSVVFEDGVLTLKLNPDKVYEVLRDGDLTRAELVKFIPEEVLDTLKEEELSPETLIRLASNYITTDDLLALKNMVPAEVFFEYFDLSMIEEVITVKELLDIVSIDEILDGIDDDALLSLVNDEAFRILLNEKAKNEVLTDDFVKDIITAEGNKEKIEALVEEKHDALMELVSNEVVNKLLDDPAYADEKAALFALIESDNTLDKILADDETVTKIKEFLLTHDLHALEQDEEAMERLRNSTVIRNFVASHIHPEEVIEDYEIDLTNFAKDFGISVDILKKDGNAEYIGVNMDNVLPYVDTATIDAKTFIEKGIIDLSAIPTVYPALTEDVLKDNADALGITVDEISAESSVNDLLNAVDNYELLCTLGGITADSVKNNAKALGITEEEILANVTIDVNNLVKDLVASGAINIERLCEVFPAITVEALLNKGYIKDADLAHLISDNWEQALNEGLAGEILHCIGLHSLFEDFGRDELVETIGGYVGMIEKGFISEDAVLDAIGGYATVIDLFVNHFPEKLEALIDIIGYDKWKDFVSFSDIVDRAGGYDVLASWYTVTEISDAIDAIGIKNIFDFLDENDISKKVDLEAVAKEIIDLALSRKDQLKDFAKDVKDRFTQLVTNEISTMYLNGKQIYKYGEFDLQAMVTATLQAIPDLDTFLAMESGDTFAELILSTSIRGKEIKLGFAIEFIGDLTRLQDLVSSRSEYFKLDVSDELDVTAEVVIPEVGAELYERALLSSKVPTKLKMKILELPTMTVSDMNELLKNLTDEEIAEYSAEIMDKIDEIKEKVYGKIEAKLGDDPEIVAKAKAKADELLDKFSDPAKLSALRDKGITAMTKLSAKMGDRTLSDLYRGNSVFSFERGFNLDLYKYVNKIVTIPDDVYVIFGNDLTLTGSLDMTLTVNGLYTATVIDSDGTEHTYFLPEGMALSKINALTDLDYVFTDEKMPAKDVTFIYEDVYVIEFYNEAGELIKSISYTEDQLPTDLPTAPAKSGYTAKWSDFELLSSQLIKVTPVYTVIETKPSYTFGGETVELDITVSVEDKEVELPDLKNPGYKQQTFFVDVDNDHEFDDGVDFYLTYDAENDKYIVPDGYSFPAVDTDKGEFVHFIPVFDPLKYKTSYHFKGETVIIEDVHVTVEDREVSLPTISYAGYTLEGWYADVNGNNVIDKDVDVFLTKKVSTFALRAITVGDKETYAIVDAEDSFPALDEGEDVVFLPYFTTNSYKVTFVSGTTSSDTSFSVEDLKIVFPANPTPDEGFRFIGWYMDVNEDGDVEDADDVKITDAFVPELKDYTFYAKFERIPYFHLFFMNGSSVVTMASFTDEDVIAGISFDLPAAPKAPDGERFIGWYLDDVKLTDKYTPVLDELTGSFINIYAKFEKIPTFNVEIVVGDSTTSSTFTDEDVADGYKITLPADPTPADGYRFIGWFCGDVKITDAFVPELKDYKIEAKFELIPVYKVQFMNGTTVFHEISFREDKLPETVELPTAIPTTISGYRFAGWYMDVNGDNDVDDTGDYLVTEAFKPEAKSYKLFARFEKIPTHTVTFVVGDEVKETVTFKEGDTALSVVPTVPAKEGYTGAWESYTLGNTDLVVKAVYTPIEYTATFKTGDTTVEIKFTVETEKLEGIPEVPAKEGYTGKWAEFTLSAKDITVEAEYTPIVYKAVFVADGKVISTVDFTVLDTNITLPEVPAKDGYVGKWEAFTLGAADITIKAVYVEEGAETGDGEDSDSETAPIIVYEEDDRSFIIWIVLVALVVILIAVWVISKKNDGSNGDGGAAASEPTTEDPEVKAAKKRNKNGDKKKKKKKKKKKSNDGRGRTGKNIFGK